MRTVMTVVVVAAACSSCSKERVEFGAITDDGISAVNDWCGERIEHRSTFFHRTPTQDPATVADLERKEAEWSILRNKKLLGLSCFGEVWRNANLVFDATSKQLIELHITADVSQFDAMIDRVLVPALREPQRRGLADLRVWAKTAKNGTSKTWRQPGSAMGATYFAPKGDSPGWLDFFAVVTIPERDDESD